jgi:hypothetical protein
MIYFLFLAQMNQRCCAGKGGIAIEFHANKLLSPASFWTEKRKEGRKRVGRKFSLTKRQTTTQMWKVQEGKSSANAGDDQEGNAYATQMNEFF